MMKPDGGFFKRLFSPERVAKMKEKKANRPSFPQRMGFGRKTTGRATSVPKPPEGGEMGVRRGSIFGRRRMPSERSY